MNKINQEQKTPKLFEVHIACFGELQTGDIDAEDREDHKIISLLEQGYEYVCTSEKIDPATNLVYDRVMFFRKPLTTAKSLPPANEVQDCASCYYSTVPKSEQHCGYCDVTNLIRSEWKPIECEEGST